MAHILRKTESLATELATAHNALMAYIGALSFSHLDASETTVLGADSTNTATAIVLVNECKRVYNGVTGGWLGHRSDTLAHAAADSTNTVTAADASTLATAYALANQIKLKFNTHLTQAGKHYTNDTTNGVTASDGSDEATTVTLVNQIKAKLNLHMASAPVESWLYRVVDG